MAIKTKHSTDYELSATSTTIQDSSGNARVTVSANDMTLNCGLYLHGTDVLVGASPYAVVATDVVLRVQTAGGAIHIDLPAAASSTGRVLWIVDWDGSASGNNVTIDGNGANVQGAASLTIGTDRQGYLLHCDGTEWCQIGVAIDTDT